MEGENEGRSETLMSDGRNPFSGNKKRMEEEKGEKMDEDWRGDNLRMILRRGKKERKEGRGGETPQFKCPVNIMNG